MPSDIHEAANTTKEGWIAWFCPLKLYRHYSGCRIWSGLLYRNYIKLYVSFCAARPGFVAYLFVVQYTTAVLYRCFYIRFVLPLINADAIANSNDFAALQAQKSCASVQHFAPFPLFGRARSTSRYRMPPVLPSVGPEATLRTPDFRLPAIRPTFIFRPLRINLSTPKIKKVANECLQPSRPPGRLRRERVLNL